MVKQPKCIELSNNTTEINVELKDYYGINMEEPSNNPFYDLIEGKGLDKILNRGTLKLEVMYDNDVKYEPILTNIIRVCLEGEEVLCKLEVRFLKLIKK